MHTVALIAGLLFMPAVLYAGLSVVPLVNIIAADAFANEAPGAPPTGTALESRNATFIVSRGCCTAQSLTVHYAISGTASNGSDYVRVTGRATIPAGRKTARITINPADEQIPEERESVVLTLAPGRSYRLGPNIRAKAFITDYRRNDGGGFIGPPACWWCPPGVSWQPLPNP